MSPVPLKLIIAQLRAEPSRTWSIVITLFGDAIVPRGGSLGMTTMLTAFAGMGVAGGVVRTAMSRLAADGWVERARVGRHSFYRLTELGRSTFAAAADQIYGGTRDVWDGKMLMVLLGEGPRRDAVRRALEANGFGLAASGAWVAPSWTPVPPEAADSMRLQVTADEQTAAALARRAWCSGRLEEGYVRFVRTFSPLSNWLSAGGDLADLEALIARTLLIHQFRRLVLHDPRLPDALLPPEWPGRSARALCVTLYSRLLPGSERWLDEHGRAEFDRLPPPSIDLYDRFK